MKLHWSPVSPYVRKVMICAHETGLLDRIELVRSVVAMSKPNAAVMRDNPLGKIPTLVTETGSLFDSVVICEYLDFQQRGPRLFPEAPAERFQALRWHALGDGMLDVAILWRNERQKPLAQQTPAWLAAFELKMRAALDVIERDMASLETLRFGIGQIAIGCALGYLDFRFPDLDWRHERARSARWFAGFSERPSVQATLPLEDTPASSP